MASVVSRARAIAAGSVGRVTVEELRGLDRRALLELNEELTRAQRRIDGNRALVARELAQRSDAPPSESVARREGFRNAKDLIASTTGSSPAQAQRMIDLGELLAHDEEAQQSTRTAVPNGPVPNSPAPKSAGPLLPVLSAAVRECEISSEAASAISAMAHRVFTRVTPERLAEAEVFLVSRAPGLNMYRLRDLIKRVEASMDIEGLKAKERRQVAERHLHVFEDSDGMIVIKGRLDIATGAPIKAAIDAIVTRDIQTKRDGGTVVTDDRSVVQMAADALALICTHATTCDARDIKRCSTTVVVRMHLSDLQEKATQAGLATSDGLASNGLGTVDGLGQPLTAGQLRRLVADAGIIPAVLGGESEVLDLGRQERLFTRAQRVALVERDGGCASCGAPPSWCDAHHIQWWERDRGKTDIDNGVMLCRSCHTRMHHSGWGITATRAEVFFIPPASVDPTRTPRPGGRKAFDLVS